MGLRRRWFGALLGVGAAGIAATIGAFVATSATPGGSGAPPPASGHGVAPSGSPSGSPSGQTPSPDPTTAEPGPSASPPLSLPDQTPAAADRHRHDGERGHHNKGDE
jgi:hypothetical protein